MKNRMKEKSEGKIDFSRENPWGGGGAQFVQQLEKMRPFWKGSEGQE